MEISFSVIIELFTATILTWGAWLLWTISIEVSKLTQWKEDHIANHLDTSKKKRK